eukprot:CAMPEP_0197626216 /NCGR_PEP_ID=MMETSP1338-20131121/5285_1 /TAXON_ID=43686 ORGANISM="Pelagodinium beii, Strain RCC1491" /NCGR_SAMPLE_ID=MMETSP1338 /ASSEMBLY_ACC=CAM_ASM_000754 /LENGTH=631 /DNA_ID=CAMNT_0043196739 /DNA_START=30 /DNA_END=1925 /DNA_ORIENTATION=+
MALPSLARLASELEVFCLKWAGYGSLEVILFLICAWKIWKSLLQQQVSDLLAGFAGPPAVVVEAREAETRRGAAKGEVGRKFDYAKEWPTWPKTSIPCWDPCTSEFLGEMPAMGEAEISKIMTNARKAQSTWKESAFAQRRHLLLTIHRFVLENMDTICTVACRDSGKTVIDAMVGELTVTLEKLRWTVANGEQYLLPEYRDSGLMNLHKTSRLEWVPVGVVGAIVPWNYPFHNLFNPLIAAVFSGNAIVIKVSEFSAWSAGYLGRAIRACLEAAGAPPDLVQIATGYSEAGRTLVEQSDKVIFVGSVAVGRKVMESASKAPIITPVILELGGKDPFVVCDDAQVDEAMTQLVVRGAFQNMGQNCAGPERFIVYDGVYVRFCEQVAALVKRLRQGSALGADGEHVDCGACVHPPSLENYQRLVDDAKAKGARVLCGGRRSKDLPDGQFFEPTVLADVTDTMLIAQEETFGPILSIFRVKAASAEAMDAEALRIANNCAFALSSCAHSADQSRAAKLCAAFEAGMASVNDVEGTTYLSQSLPFGGFKDSGFGRFAGPEGLRGLCHERSIVQNRASFLKTSIPPAIAYPANGQGEAFCRGLNFLLYGLGPLQRLQGLLGLISASMTGSPKKNA